MPERVLNLKIRVDDDGTLHVLDTAERDVKDLGSTVDREGRTMAGAMEQVGAAIAAAFALDRLRRFGAELLDLASVQETAERRIEAVVRATGGAAGFTADQLKDMASEFQAALGVADEEILDTQAKLLTFRNVTGDVFRETIELAQDMSFVLGQDVRSSVIQLGKALQDPIRGMTALSRAGVTFDDQQKELIKTAQESNDLLAAQRVILEELETEFGNTTRSLEGTYTKAVGDLNNAWGDLLESFGLLVARSPDIVSVLESITDKISGMAAAIREVGGIRNFWAAIASLFPGGDPGVRAELLAYLSGEGPPVATDENGRPLITINRRSGGGGTPEPPPAAPARPGRVETGLGYVDLNQLLRDQARAQARAERELLDQAPILLGYEELNDLTQEIAETQQTWIDGAKQGFADYTEAALDAARQAEQAVTGTFRHMEDALVDFVSTGKLNFRDFADNVIEDLARIAIQENITGPLAHALGGAFSSYIGGGTATPTAAPAPAPYLPRVPAGRSMSGVTEVNVHNYTGADVRTAERTAAGGGVALDLIIGQAAAGDVRRGGDLDRAIQSVYGIQRRGR